MWRRLARVILVVAFFSIFTSEGFAQRRTKYPELPKLGELAKQKSNEKDRKQRSDSVAKNSQQKPNGSVPSGRESKSGVPAKLASSGQPDSSQQRSKPKGDQKSTGKVSNDGKTSKSKVPASLASAKKGLVPNRSITGQEPSGNSGGDSDVGEDSESKDGNDEEGGEEEEEDDEDEEEEEEEPWSTLFVPERHSFFDDRVKVEAVYTNDLFHLARGGFKTQGATRYRGNMDVTFTIDGERAFKTPGGTLLIYYQQGHGEGITGDFLGDYQVISNIDAGPLNQVSEYWWLQEFEGSWCKIGKQDANADFCVADLAVDFVQSSFGIMPNVPIPTFPNPGLGVSGFWQVNDSLGLGCGIYDGSPNGATWGFEQFGVDGLVSVGEAVFSFEERWDLKVRAGAWLHTGDFELLQVGPPELQRTNHGVYSNFDKLLFREAADEEQGLGWFGQYSWAPENRNELEHYYGTGLLYKGLLAGRDQDYAGLAYANARFGDRISGIDGRTYESVVELFYAAQVNRFTLVQPDLQFIGNPGGNGRDGLAVGLRCEVAF